MKAAAVTIALLVLQSVCAQAQTPSRALDERLDEPLKMSLGNVPVMDKLASSVAPTLPAHGAPARPPRTRAENNSDSDTGLWGTTEFLLWRVKSEQLPVLLKVSPASGSAATIGGGPVRHGNFPGGRVTLGVWLNDARTVGVEGSYLFLSSRAAAFSAGAGGETGSAVLTRPFTRALGGGRDSLFVASPGFARGTFDASLPFSMRGAEASLRYRTRWAGGDHASLLFGLRYLRLGERLTIDDMHAVSPVTLLGSGSDIIFILRDQFAADNRFLGGQAGWRGEYGRGRLGLGVEGKLGLGGMRETVTIEGSTTRGRFDNLTRAFIVTDTSAGGLLALPSNIGSYRRTEFALVPEVKAVASYRLTDHVRAFAGYDLIYASRAVRPGEQIDTVVNRFHVPAIIYLDEINSITRSQPPNRPAFNFSSSRFWAGGLTAGLGLRF